MRLIGKMHQLINKKAQLNSILLGEQKTKRVILKSFSLLIDIFPLPVEAKRLDVFLGNWNVEGTLTFMGKPFGVKGIAKFSSVAKGWGVLATTN